MVFSSDCTSELSSPIFHQLIRISGAEAGTLGFVSGREVRTVECLLKCNVLLKLPKEPVKNADSDPVGLGLSHRLGLSKKIQGDTHVASAWATLSRKLQMACL